MFHTICLNFEIIDLSIQHTDKIISHTLEHAAANKYADIITAANCKFVIHSTVMKYINPTHSSYSAMYGKFL